MQVGNAARGAGTIPRRGRLEAWLAVAIVVVVVALGSLLLGQADPFGAGATGTGDVARDTGSAIVHDDAGGMPR